MFNASDGQQLTEPINETVAKQMGCTKKNCHINFIHLIMCNGYMLHYAKK